MDYKIKSNYNFSKLIIQDKLKNIELEVPFQVNKLSDAFKNKMIDSTILIEHLNKLVGVGKSEYYLKLIIDECESNNEPPQLPSDFNLKQILKRTDELLDQYKLLNKQLISNSSPIQQHQKPQQQSQENPQKLVNKKCNCKELFSDNANEFNILEKLSKFTSDHRMTEYCDETCIYLICKKYQDVIEYANNRIFFYQSLQPDEKTGKYSNCKNVGFIEFYQYINSMIPSVAPLFKRVEDSIKFKIRNKKLIINKETKNNQSLYGLYWSSNNIVSYEINSNTPIEK